MHVRLISLFLIIIAASSFSACEKNTQSKKNEAVAPVAALEEKDFELAGLKLGMTRQQVEAVKGKPKNREKEKVFNPSIEQDVEREWWEYDDLSVIFNWEVVGEISTSSSKYVTPRGLKVGDPLGKAIALYGPVVDTEGKTTTPADSDITTYFYDEQMEAIEISYDKSMITRIHIVRIID